MAAALKERIVRMSRLGKLRNERDADLARADEQYRHECSEAWRRREADARQIKNEYRDKLAKLGLHN